MNTWITNRDATYHIFSLMHLFSYYKSIVVIPVKLPIRVYTSPPKILRTLG